MLITFVLILFFVTQFNQTVSNLRKRTVLLFFGIYLLITIFDLGWLEFVNHRSFHLSDPSVYYEIVLGVSFWDACQLSPPFYYLYNWYYASIYSNPTIVSLFIKFNNVILCLALFLFVTKKKASVNGIDYFLLCSP
jgi:hypothetical protein